MRHGIKVGTGYKDMTTMARYGTIQSVTTMRRSNHRPYILGFGHLKKYS